MLRKPFILAQEFQSALPRGERRVGVLQWKRLMSYFNPRSRVGSDSKYFLRLAQQYNFNPRSRVGSDIYDAAGLIKGYISIRAPAWGATFVTPYFFACFFDFNPRSRVGSDSAKRHW